MQKLFTQESLSTLIVFFLNSLVIYRKQDIVQIFTKQRIQHWLLFFPSILTPPWTAPCRYNFFLSWKFAVKFFLKNLFDLEFYIAKNKKGQFSFKGNSNFIKCKLTMEGKGHVTVRIAFATRKLEEKTAGLLEGKARVILYVVLRGDTWVFL